MQTLFSRLYSRRSRREEALTVSRIERPAALTVQNTQTRLLKNRFNALVFLSALILFPFLTKAQLISPASLPLYFEANGDQTQFLSSGNGFEFAISASGVQMALRESRDHAATAQMRFVGGNPAAQIHGGGEMSGKVNYLIGNDRSQWQTGLPTYGTVQVSELYAGINMLFHGNQRQLEYDFTIAPGADPNAIKMQFDGVDKISITPQGDLVLKVGNHELRQPAPEIFQTVGNARKIIAGGYKVLDARTVAFRINKYDHSLPLVIDPTLGFSTFFGGTLSDTAWAITMDTGGNIYIAGQTVSKGFATFGAYQTNYDGGTTVGDAFVAELSGSPPTNLVYLTYLGGNADDAAYGLAVDGSGQAFITGATESANFPTNNAIPGHSKISGNLGPTGSYFADGFVSELGAGGSNLIYSTYLGGSSGDAAYGIALDSSDDAYVTGFSSSTNFPVTANALQTHLQTTNGTTFLTANAFVSEIANGGGTLIYSTYLGGTNYDVGRAIYVDTSDNVYVAGYSGSFNFPTWNTPVNLPHGQYLNGVTNQTGGLYSDAFVTKFPPLNGTILPAAQTNFYYSTLLGGTNSDAAYGIAADSAGNAYVTGWTSSTNFPVISPPTNGLTSFLTTNGIFGPVATNVFLTRIGPNGTVDNSVVFGGNSMDIGFGVTVDSAGDAFVVGMETSRTNFPTVNAFNAGSLFSTNSSGLGNSDAFVTGISADWSNVFYSVCIGGNQNTYGYGIVLDSSTNVYITGSTASTNFPTLNTGRFSFNGSNFINGTNYINGMNFSGTTDAFLSEIVFAPPIPSSFDVEPKAQTNGLGATVTFAVTFSGGESSDMFFQWQTNGHNLVNGGRISGVNTATLTITNAQPSDSRTNYGVIVSYPGGPFTQSNLILSVVSGPFIVMGPTNQILVPGSNMSFSVVASGSPIAYAWAYSNSVFFNYITDYTNYITNSDHYIGVTNATLTISNVQPSDAGMYVVVVQYLPNQKLNVNAGALLVDPLSVITAPTNQIASVGSPVSFTVVASGFPLSYQWSNSVTGTFLINGVNIIGTNAASTNGLDISGANSSTLTISNVQTNDAGTYTVFIDNGQDYTDLSGSTNLSATLTVIPASDPTFTSFAPAAGGLGNGMVLSGVGGTNNGTYYILTSSNMMTPTSQWTPMATNQFDGQGKFIFTNPVSTNGSQFFMLKQP